MKHYVTLGTSYRLFVTYFRPWDEASMSLKVQCAYNPLCKIKI